jgi:hypothetical protein
MRGLKNLVFPLVIFFLLPSSVLSSPPPGAPTDKDPNAYKGLSADEIARLKKGEIVVIKELSREETTSKGMVQVALIFNKRIDEVWSLMTQGFRQEEYLPNLDRSILVKKLPDGDIIENRLKVFFVELRFWVRGYHYPDRYYIRWNLAEGYKNDIKNLEGFWQFYYIDETHTLARYGTHTETGFGVPAKVQEFLARRDIPESLSRLKKWVESDGAWKKPGYKPSPSD